MKKKNNTWTQKILYGNYTYVSARDNTINSLFNKKGLWAIP